jgi:hypothetical protein
MTTHADSGDYTWPLESGGALVDVPQRYDTRTPSQRHDLRIAVLEQQVAELTEMVRKLLDDGK